MDPMQALTYLKQMTEQTPAPLGAHVQASEAFRIVRAALTQEKPSGDQS